MGSTALTVVRHFGSNKQALISLLKGAPVLPSADSSCLLCIARWESSGVH